MKEYFEKFAAIIEKIHILYRILISIAIISLFSIGYFFLFIMPQFDEIEQLHQKNRMLQNQLSRSMLKARELTKYQKLTKEAEKSFEKEKRVLPESQDIRILLENVARLKQESGLTFTLFKPEKEVAKDFYAEIPISMKLTGHFHNVGVFFDKIAKLSRLVHIKDFNIDSAESEDDISLIQVSCKAITYKFIQQK